MTKYKCGCKSDVIIADSNPLTIAAWLEWKDTVGYEGDKSQCWECFCEQEEKWREKWKKN